MEDLRRSLARYRVFAGLADADLELLAGCAKNVRFGRDVYLFREGDPADIFYLVREGLIAVEIHQPGGRNRVVQTLGTGDVVGWSWIIPPYRHVLDVRAAEPVLALALDGACLRDKCDADPRLGYELMQRFACIAVTRLQSTLVQLMDVYAPHPVR
jgi:CRP/FNR family transcriptional regulator, cyclic AMP receptor protein